MFRKFLSVLLAIVMMMGIFTALPVAINAQEVDVVDVGLESTGNSTIDAFINDSRWTNGVSWTGGQAPKISSFKGQDCAAYCADYVKYCYGSNNPRSGEVFYSASETRAGDVITVGNPSDGNGHWFVVLKRSGNGLYVAEGNYAKKVRIGWNYSVSGNSFTGTSYGFTAGYHYLGGGLDFTPVDIGTDFYGSIVNLAVNKPIKVSGGNVVCGVRNGSDEQKWRFERQGDLSYKIINVANGECLDDDNYGTADNTNIKTCGSNDSDAQRWFFRYNGSGYSLVPKCARNLAMDLVNGTSNEGDNIAAWTFVENNGNQIYGVDHQPSFTPVDIGTNFYGSIVNLAANKPIKVSNNNVVMGVRNGSDEQKWKFERMDDRMYKITNVATGKCLDDDNYGTTDDTNIKVVDSNNEPAQRWYFRKNGSGYSLIPRCAQNLAMDMVGGNSSEGNNVAAWTFVENNGNQIFGIDIQPSFTPQDLGDRFTVNIIHSTSGSVVTENSENNVVIQKFSGSDSQKWLFERMNDRMYKITNVASGRVLDIDNGGTTDDTNIQTWASLDNLHQRWYLWKNGSGYSLVPKCSLNLAMDLVGGKTEDGSNLAAWTCVSGNGNQIYTLELKVVEPTIVPTTPTEQPTTPTEPTIPTEPKTIILGDVDGDREVTIIDATAIQRYLASIPTASYSEKAADADEDGEVTIIDATVIQRHLAQLPSNENIGKPMG